MTVRVQEADFDVGAELVAMRAGEARVGAQASFLGLVRDLNDGASVSEMTLEHYPGMTEKALAEIVAEARVLAEIRLLLDEERINNGLLAAADICSTSAAFCCVMPSICDTASLTCEMPINCSRAPVLISLIT